MNKQNETPLGSDALTRRSFLQKSSSAAAGASLLATLPVARYAHAAGKEELKVALVGAGGRGTGAANHALNTHNLGQIKVVAVADAFEDRLANSLSQLRRQHPDRIDVTPDREYVGFDGYKQAIAQADVVILATPPGFRPIHFEEAVRQGKHVFMEKPVATDAPGVRKVLAAAKIAKEKNLKVAVGLQRHHQPNYKESIQRIQDGAIGDIHSMRVYWNGGPVGPKYTRERVRGMVGREPTEMEYQMRNWYMFNWLCGDHIVEQHIHNLDVGNWIKGAYPVRASGMGGRAYQKGPDSGEIFDHHYVEYEFADGSFMFSQCRQIPQCKNDVSEAVQGTKGSWDSKGRPPFAIRDLKGNVTWRYQQAEGDSNDGHQLEHFPFFKAIRENEAHNEAEYGAYSTLTAIMGRMATYSGKEIEWEAALKSELSIMPDSYAWDAKPKSLPGPDGNYEIPLPGKTVVL
jgi:myo-inositol 2-dehydrogenase / D-chiro-inositol 1-dehydrogenase